MASYKRSCVLWKRGGYLLLFLLMSPLGIPSHAELQHAVLKVDGLACPFCAYGLEKKLKKLEGIAKIHVDMKKGEVALKLKERSLLTVASLQKAVKKAGFTLREVAIEAVGEFHKGRFAISGTKEELKFPGETGTPQGLVKVTGKVVFKEKKEPRLLLKKVVSLTKEENS